MRKKVVGLVLAVVVCVGLVSADRPGAAEAKKEPQVGGVQGYVSDIAAYGARSGRLAECSATVSDGKLGAGDQIHVSTSDPLLQAALISAAERQVLVEVLYHPEASPDKQERGRAIQVRLLDQPRYQREKAKVVTVVDIGADKKLSPPKLWAGVSASSPNSTSNAMFTVPQVERLMIGFALVNDGTDPVPFERGETELVINGKPLGGFGKNFREGPVWDRLVPGKPFDAALGLGKHFAKPGVYKVQWRGKGFESAVLELRVVDK